MKFLCKIHLHSWEESERRLGLGIHPEHRKCTRCKAEQVCSGSPWFIWCYLDDDQLGLRETKEDDGKWIEELKKRMEPK